MLRRRSSRPSVTHLPCSSRIRRSRRTRCSGSESEAGRPRWGRFASRLFCSWKARGSPGIGQSPLSPAGTAPVHFAGFHLWCPGAGRGPGTERQESGRSVSPGVYRTKRNFITRQKTVWRRKWLQISVSQTLSRRTQKAFRKNQVGKTQTWVPPGGS